MYHFTVLALFFLFYEQTVFSATVDQRQTGDLNVQIDLKNLQIVGLMKGKEEYVDYDYAYDYSEMTIKPPNGTTTKKPLNVTEPATSDKDKTTAVTTVSAELDQTTSSIENKSSTETVTSAPTTEQSDPSTATQLAPDLVGSNSTSSDCKRGFFRNNKGNCELKLQNPSNAVTTDETLNQMNEEFFCCLSPSFAFSDKKSVVCGAPYDKPNFQCYSRLLKMIKQKAKLNMSNGVKQP